MKKHPLYHCLIKQYLCLKVYSYISLFTTKKITLYKLVKIIFERVSSEGRFICKSYMKILMHCNCPIKKNEEF